MSCPNQSPAKVSSALQSNGRLELRCKPSKPFQAPESIATDISGDQYEPSQMGLSYITELFLHSSSQESRFLIEKLNQGFGKGLNPQLTTDGTGGNYILRDPNKQPRAIFKPIDQQAFAPGNPKAYIGSIGSKSMRPGVLSGQLAQREVAACLLDQTGFAKVPLTLMAQSRHPAFNNLSNDVKHGSLQVYVKNQGTADDFSYSMFSKQQIQKIAVLDLRILNLDRNLANLLVTWDYQLVPIDHGLSIPDTLEIMQDDICWMNWPQAKEPISLECLEFIKNIDPAADVSLLQRHLTIRQQCLQNIWIAGIFLKKAANKMLTLHQIGQMVYRQEQNQPSALESIISKTKGLYSAIKANLEYWPQESKAVRRERAYSKDESDLVKLNLAQAVDFQALIELQYEDDEDQETVVLQTSCLSFPPCSQNIKSPLDHMYDDRFFHFLEAFMDQTIERKLKHARKFELPGGRLRSNSYLWEKINQSLYGLIKVTTQNGCEEIEHFVV